jgi:hypothetical protein
MARTRDDHAIVFGILVFQSRAVREPISGGCGSDHGRITARPGKPDFRRAFTVYPGLRDLAAASGIAATALSLFRFDVIEKGL